MGYFSVVAATSENTVVTEYEPVKRRSETYQSEAELEKEFIQLLCEQGYEYLSIHSEQELIQNLRNKLEEIAGAEYAKTGKYIRPIALFQAQPKGKEDATTFEKLRDKLVDAGIPAEQIAIRTADVNELKQVDLLSPGCPIRYIITVNALKEGWDCPFAYILASLANKTSPVDVEQILGRILRLRKDP